MQSNTKSIFSRETIERIFQQNFGEDIVVDTITEITEGWFNAVYIVSFIGEDAEGHKELVLKTGIQENKYVLRYEKEIMRTELYVYSLLEDTIVPVPKILVKDLTKSIVDCDYFIMEKLQGNNWGYLAEQISSDNEEKLIADIARYAATLHNIKGNYFGYIKDDQSYHYPDWKSAFQGMLTMQIEDGRLGNVILPYDEILKCFEPHWDILNEIKEPSLVNFDMWKKNVMLIEKNGEYIIDGIIDHERAFYGDPYAEFISLNTMCGDIENSTTFQQSYSSVSGKAFTYTQNDKIRYYMYSIYLSLLMGVEVYRYNDEDKKSMLEYCNRLLINQMNELNRL